MKFTTWQDVMLYIAGGNDPICGDDTTESIQWIAKRINKAVSTTYGYFEGRGEPSISEARNLHVDLVKDYDCHVVLQFIEDEFHNYSGTANGTVQDDMWNIHEQSTDAARYYKQAKGGDLKALQLYFDEVKNMEKEIQDLHAEYQRLKELQS